MSLKVAFSKYVTCRNNHRDSEEYNEACKNLHEALMENIATYDTFISMYEEGPLEDGFSNAGRDALVFANMCSSIISKGSYSWGLVITLDGFWKYLRENHYV